MSESERLHNVPRFCSGGAEPHSMIQWFDPRMIACPVCQLQAEVKKLQQFLSPKPAPDLE